jgi:hypothetical protein
VRNSCRTWRSTFFAWNLRTRPVWNESLRKRFSRSVRRCVRDGLLPTLAEGNHGETSVTALAVAPAPPLDSR